MADRIDRPEPPTKSSFAARAPMRSLPERFSSPVRENHEHAERMSRLGSSRVGDGVSDVLNEIRKSDGSPRDRIDTGNIAVDQILQQERDRQSALEQGREDYYAATGIPAELSGGDAIDAYDLAARDRDPANLNIGSGNPPFALSPDEDSLELEPSGHVNEAPGLTGDGPPTASTAFSTAEDSPRRRMREEDADDDTVPQTPISGLAPAYEAALNTAAAITRDLDGVTGSSTPVTDSAEWTGARTARQKAKVVRQFAPLALGGVDQLIVAVEDKRWNSPEAETALNNLRNLRTAIDDLIEAAERKGPLDNAMTTLRTEVTGYAKSIGKTAMFATGSVPTAIGVMYLLGLLTSIPIDSGLLAASFGGVTGLTTLGGHARR